jgi:hypothetical protein
MKNIIIFLIVLTIINISCVNRSINIVGVVSDNENFIDFFNNPFEKNKIPSVVNYDIDLIREEYGEPKSIKTTNIINKHDSNIIDKLIQINYDAITFEYYYITYKKQYYLVTIAIKNNDYKMKYGVKLGMKKDKIEQLFGNTNPGIDEYDGMLNYIYYMNDIYLSRLITFKVDEDNQLNEIIISRCLD